MRVWPSTPRHPRSDLAIRFLSALGFGWGAYRRGAGSWLGLLCAVLTLLYLYGVLDSAIWIWAEWSVKREAKAKEEGR